ncbi:MAG: hypothetical protein AB1Z98_06860 [Nannocystaceae bacterium]
MNPERLYCVLSGIDGKFHVVTRFGEPILCIYKFVFGPASLETCTVKARALNAIPLEVGSEVLRVDDGVHAIRSASLAVSRLTHHVQEEAERFIQLSEDQRAEHMASVRRALAALNDDELDRVLKEGADRAASERGKWAATLGAYGFLLGAGMGAAGTWGLGTYAGAVAGGAIGAALGIAFDAMM